jgi:hypothetical protein
MGGTAWGGDGGWGARSPGSGAGSPTHRRFEGYGCGPGRTMCEPPSSPSGPPETSFIGTRHPRPDAAVSAFSRAVLRAVSQAVTGRSRTHRLRYDVTSGKCESEENSARTPNRVELSYAGQRPSFLASSTSGMHARVAAVRRFLGEAPVWWNSRSAATGDAGWYSPRPKPARELTP